MSLPDHWVPLEDIIKVVESSKAEVTEDSPRKWSWSRNTDCKYIDVRIDMRDGHATLKDRHGNFITLEQLMRQHGHEVDPDDKTGLSYRPVFEPRA